MNLKSHLRFGALMLGLSLCGGLLTTPANAAPAKGAAKAGAKEGKGKGPRGGGRGGMRGGMRGGGMRMMKELNLTDAQKAKLKPVMEAQRDQMMAMRDDTTMDRKAKMTRMKAIRATTEKKVNAILTADQKKKLEAMKAKMQAERKAAGKDGKGRRADGRGPQAPAPAL